MAHRIATGGFLIPGDSNHRIATGGFEIGELVVSVAVRVVWDAPGVPQVRVVYDAPGEPQVRVIWSEAQPMGNQLNIGDYFERQFNLLDIDDNAVTPTTAVSMTDEPSGSSVTATLVDNGAGADPRYKLKVGPFTHEGWHEARMVFSGTGTGQEPERFLVEA